MALPWLSVLDPPTALTKIEVSDVGTQTENVDIVPVGTQTDEPQTKRKRWKTKARAPSAGIDDLVSAPPEVWEVIDDDDEFETLLGLGWRVHGNPGGLVFLEQEVRQRMWANWKKDFPDIEAIEKYLDEHRIEFRRGESFPYAIDSINNDNYDDYDSIAPSPLPEAGDETDASIAPSLLPKAGDESRIRYIDECNNDIDVGKMVEAGTITQSQASRLRVFMQSLAKETKVIDLNPEPTFIDDRMFDFDALDSADDDGFYEICPFGDLQVDKVEGVINEGRWLRVRNGITLDSGSSVFVMPTGWLEMFKLTESEVSRRGQTYQAAAKDGRPIVNEGQRTIRFSTKPGADGEKRKMTCQVAAVNKILASVAGICDQGSEVRFRTEGGVIEDLKSGALTHFRRHGNVCVMDAWIPNPDFVEPSDEVMLFTRLGENR
jgi:hypothetical protein